jgi:hypothetical protein
MFVRLSRPIEWRRIKRWAGQGIGIPAEDDVVALPAIGRAQESDKAHPGRFPLEKIVFSERYGEAWKRRQ